MSVRYFSPSEYCFEAILEIRGLYGRHWQAFNFVLEEQLLIPYQVVGKERPQGGAIDLFGAQCSKIPQSKIQSSYSTQKPSYQLYPFKIVIDGTKYVLNAASEAQREHCILIYKLAAEDPEWINPFHLNSNRDTSDQRSFSIEYDAHEYMPVEYFEIMQQFQERLSVRTAAGGWEECCFRLTGRRLVLTPLHSQSHSTHYYSSNSENYKSDNAADGSLLDAVVNSNWKLSKMFSAAAEGMPFPFSLALCDSSSCAANKKSASSGNSSDNTKDSNTAKGNSGVVAMTVVFSASSEEVREACLLVLKLAAADVSQWQNPFSSFSAICQLHNTAEYIEADSEEINPRQQHHQKQSHQQQTAPPALVSMCAADAIPPIPRLIRGAAGHNISSSSIFCNNSHSSSGYSNINSRSEDIAMLIDERLEMRRNKIRNEWLSSRFLLLKIGSCAANKRLVLRACALSEGADATTAAGGDATAVVAGYGAQGRIDLSFGAKATALTAAQAGGKKFAFKVLFKQKDDDDRSLNSSSNLSTDDLENRSSDALNTSISSSSVMSMDKITSASSEVRFVFNAPSDAIRSAFIREINSHCSSAAAATFSAAIGVNKMLQLKKSTIHAQKQQQQPVVPVQQRAPRFR